MNVERVALVGLRSRARIAPFRLHRPSTIEDALEVMASAEPGTAAFMAGGIDLIGGMKAGYSPADVIHIARVEALRRIDEHDGTLRIGACATHRDIAESELIRARAPGVARCWRQLANPRVRCKGTVGGNVMAGQSGYDATLMLMAADAKASVVASEGHCVDSSIAEAAMLQGLLTSIHVPEPGTLQLRADRSLYPALVVVVGFRQGKDVVTRLHAAVGGARGQAYSAPLDVQEPVTRADLAAKAQVLARAFVSRLPAPGDDWRASGGYRTRMAAVLLQRLLAQEGRASC